MPAKVDLYADPTCETPLQSVQLSEVEIDGDVGEGAPQKVYAINSGDTILRDISVFVTGEGAQYVQMARDSDGEPDIWAAPGESILASEGSKSLWPKEIFEFWVRPLFTLDDREGVFDFEFVVRGKSIGSEVT